MAIARNIIPLIFGLFFVGMGLYILSQTALPTFQSWLAMKNWHSTQGTLLSIKSADNDTIAGYEYYVADERYENHRVYVAEFKDNIGHYHEELYDRLSHLHDKQQPITVWYNTLKPQESVIDRNMRWGLFALMVLFCSVFVLLGSTLCYAGLFSKSRNTKPKASLTKLRKQWQQQERDSEGETFLEFVQQRRIDTTENNDTESSAAETPGAWQDKKEWRTHKIKSSAKSSMISTWVIAIFWNAISAPIPFAIPEELAKGNYGILIALLFPLVGLILLYKAAQLSLEWIRFGVLQVVMDPFPGAIGGHVGGSLWIKNGKELNTAYKVELECVYTYESGSGEDRSRKESIKWAEAGTARVEALSNGVRLCFRFDVPDNLPEADIQQSGNYHFWRLKICAEIPGVDLQRQYNIPVFKTGATSRSVDHDISAQFTQARAEAARQSQAALNRGDFNSTQLARVLRYSHRDDGKNNTVDFFYFPMLRNKGLTLVSMIFAAGFGFAVYGMNTGFGGSGVFSLLILLFSIPFALVALFAGVASIYLPLNNLSVHITHGQLTSKRRLFVFPLKINRLDTDEIKQLNVQKNGSTGSGVRKIDHYKIFAINQQNEKITIAESIDGKDLAHQLKEFIEQRL